MTMLAKLERDPQPETENLEASVAQVIQACDGNLRDAIRTLLIANGFLERRNRQLASYISLGFTRGQLLADNEFEDSLQFEVRDS